MKNNITSDFAINYPLNKIEIYDWWLDKNDTVIVEFFANDSNMEATGDIRVFSHEQLRESLERHDHFDSDADGIILQHRNGEYHNADIPYLCGECLVRSEMIADMVRDYTHLSQLSEQQFSQLTPFAQQLYSEAWQQRADMPNWLYRLQKHIGNKAPDWWSPYPSVRRYAKEHRYKPLRTAA